MKQEWIDSICHLALTPETFYSGCRKIIQGYKLRFEDLWDAEDPLVLEDAGYTRSKMSHLLRLYYHEESVAAAVKLWALRRKKPSYGSVSFHCYNHFVKNDAKKKSKRASVMGPCLQSVVITQVKGNKKDGTGGKYTVDVFYRTTELLKKFPADLVFIRDVLLKDFDFSGMSFGGLTCHFANITVHPQYFVTAIPHMDNPIEVLEGIKAHDQYFFNWIVKWTARYLCPEHYRGIAKFAQALRVKDHADAAIKGKRRKKLIEYLNNNHPGYRNDYTDPDVDGED